MNKKAVIIANFGGPRCLEEIEPFLRALLTDKDVIRTPMPNLLQDWIFKRVARKRASQISHDYIQIGGKSPIYDDTEAVAEHLRSHSACTVLTFHRYLPSTHEAFKKESAALDADEVVVFPMFPQFSYATTGSIARWFQQNLPKSVVDKLRWIKSYPAHSGFVRCFQQKIQRFLQDNQLSEEETMLLFSPHGLPRSFVCLGDSYQKECELSFKAIIEQFPQILSKLSYQSKFGRGEWMRPYTNEVCEDILSASEGRRHIVFVPLSFTSDHIETLFEVEYQYLPVIRKKGLEAHRLPAFNRDAEWLAVISEIVQECPTVSNQEMIRQNKRVYCKGCTCKDEL